METKTEKLYKEWCGTDRHINDCHPVHDSSEIIEFAEYYRDKIKNKIEQDVEWPFATMGWDGSVNLCTKDGFILPNNLDRTFHPEYYPNNCEWPVNPKTGEKLSIYRAA